ncbi:MAG: hydantoinase/oxoprolinase N-terminal domain-containing protein [Desulfobacteraceae bacterium]
MTTNAVLTGSVAKTGLLTTKGFSDALQMRRGIREELYNSRYLPPPPPVPRYLRIPIEERVDYSGKMVQEIDLTEVERGIEKFKEHGIEAVGPILESYLARLTRRLGDQGFKGILLIMQSNGKAQALAAS